MFRHIFFIVTLVTTIYVWSWRLNQPSMDDSASMHMPETTIEHHHDNANQNRAEDSRNLGVANLTHDFWQWEAQGRLQLIDAIMADESLVNDRNNWMETPKTAEEIETRVEYLLDAQMAAYDVLGKFPNAKVKFMPLRGDANGLYIPQEQTIYLNSRMKWEELPYERFVEVILHENMHHIMTRMISAMDKEDYLYGDFMALARAAYFHDANGMAHDVRDIYQVNPQETVAWSVQRAARYAGIIGSDLSAWEMSARTQEIRAISERAGFEGF